MTDEKLGGRRTDVGYKRPPVETRFKNGQAPPPRKKKHRSKQSDPTQTFWEVLQEPRRARINGKARWPTTSELIVRTAFIEAEKGSPVLQRLLNQLLLGKGIPEEDRIQVHIYPD